VEAAVPPSPPPIDDTAESTIAAHDGAEKPSSPPSGRMTTANRMEMTLGGACNAIQHSSPSMQLGLLLVLQRRRGLGLKLVL
jgi:hypothetical protein